MVESALPTAGRGTRARRDEGRESCHPKARTMSTTKVRNYPHGAFQLTSCINPTNVQQHIIGNTLHIGNLSRTVTDKELSSKFAEFGKVGNVFIVKDPFTQYPLSLPLSESRGFGFVTYDDVGDAQRAMEAMDHREYCGRWVGGLMD